MFSFSMRSSPSQSHGQPRFRGTASRSAATEAKEPGTATDRSTRRRLPLVQLASDALRADCLSYRVTARVTAYCFGVAFLTLAQDIEVMVGAEHGLAPGVYDLERLATDFSALNKWLYFPSLFHILGGRTSVLKQAARVGAVMAGFAAVRPVRLLFGGLWLLYGSFGIFWGLWLWGPPDCMLLEAGWICAVFAPWTAGAHAHPSRDNSVIQSRGLAGRVACRWLLFRVVFGFGKMKFLGAPVLEQADWFLRDLLPAQPLGSAVAWLVHACSAGPPFEGFSGFLELGAWRAAYFFYFFSEILAPWGFLLFGEGRGRRWCARAVALLMLGIAMMGRYLWFNLLAIGFALPMCFSAGNGRDSDEGREVDVGTRIVPESSKKKSSASVGRKKNPSAESGIKCPRVLSKLLLGAYVLISIPFLVPSQWCSPGFLYWDTVTAWASSAPSRANAKNPLEQEDPLLAARIKETALTALRLVSSWRLVHTYGVVPPMRLPNVRAVYEVSADGRNWEAIDYWGRPTRPNDRPPWPDLGLSITSRLDYLAQWDGCEILASPAQATWPSPYVTASRFVWSQRIAWLLLSARDEDGALDNAHGAREVIHTAFRLSESAKILLPTVRYVRAWKVGLAPRKPWIGCAGAQGEEEAQQDFQNRGHRGSAGSLVWSCAAYIKEPHLSAVTKEDIIGLVVRGDRSSPERSVAGAGYQRTDEDPHRLAMRGPVDFVPQHWGHVQLSLRSADFASPQALADSRGNRQPGSPQSCLFVSHLMPGWLRPSDCGALVAGMHPVLRSVLTDPGWVDAVAESSRQNRWATARVPEG